MSHHHRLAAVVLLPLLCLSLAAAREVPSTEQIRQMVTDKQFKRALREVARALQLKGDDAIEYDRGRLLLLRADAQLGMRIEPQAAKSFRDAAEAAANDNDRATARAMSLLLSRCEQLVFTPRTGDAARQIDVVTDRQAALDALLADELAGVEPRVRGAKEKHRIADVLDAVKALEPVAFVERAATGGTMRTDEMKLSFVGQIETLLDDALIDLDRQADTIEQGALGLIAVPQPAPRAGQPPPTMIKAKKRGLSIGDEAALKGVMDVCREVVSRHREVAIQLGAEPDRFRRAGDFAIRLSSKAGAILRADYTGVVERPLNALPPAPTGEQKTITSSPQPGPAGPQQPAE